MPTKQERYAQLISARRRCRRPECRPLCNQADVDGGIYDLPQIGSLSLWQGNLDAKLMVVLRDWGSIQDLRTWKGYPTHGRGISKTNKKLITLLNSIGITIAECTPGQVQSSLFFTNSILCLQPEKRSAPVKQGP